jgi:hypothetical protein
MLLMIPGESRRFESCERVRDPVLFTDRWSLIKAPMSKRARRILTDEEAAQKVVSAARKGESTTVEVDGRTYVVRRASRSSPDRPETSEGASRSWLDLLPF